MEKRPAKNQQTYLAIGAIIAWFAILVQFYLMIGNRVAGIPETIVRFFSFYTILTNILVALCFTTLWLNPKSGLGHFFSKPVTQTAIAVYITMVGIVYNSILRFVWKPQGLQMVVDELLHVVVPVLFILYWVLFTPKAGLQWKNVFPWLIYPLVYLLFIFARGAMSGFYPYPFIHVKTLGFNKVLLNSVGLSIAFLLLSLLFVAIAKMVSRRSL